MAVRHSKLTAFGQEVKKKLIEKDMTQVELASLVGCNKQYLHKILTGERSGKKYVEIISEILSIETIAG